MLRLLVLFYLAWVTTAKYIISVSQKIHDDCLDFEEVILCIVDDHEITETFLSDENVLDIWQDDVAYAANCQSNAPWHLANLNDLKFPPGNTFAYDTPQRRTTVYVLDTWMDVDHFEFEGRARRGPAYEHGGEGKQAHATHVAGLIASSRYGVNKHARIVSVQVLNGNSYGSWSNILRGLDWVNHQKNKSVVNLSIGGGRNEAVNRAVEAMANRGWKIAIAAGNSHDNACKYSPASALSRNSVTIGAYNRHGNFAEFSNHAECVSFNAPGEAVLSLCPNNYLCYMSGTSMATPIVAGIWSLNPVMDKHDLLKMTKPVIKNVPWRTTNRAIMLESRDRCPVFIIQDYNL